MCTNEHYTSYVCIDLPYQNKKYDERFNSLVLILKRLLSLTYLIKVLMIYHVYKI